MRRRKTFDRAVLRRYACGWAGSLGNLVAPGGVYVKGRNWTHD